MSRLAVETRLVVCNAARPPRLVGKEAAGVPKVVTIERSRGWPMSALAAALVIGLPLGLTPFQVAAHDHDTYHAEFYSNWVTREGISCCNTRDCSPIDDKNVRIRSGGVEVYVEGEWVPVSPEKVRPYHAPDMNSHVCHIGRIIFCFVFGGGT